jgi:hypothetical protein
MTDHTARARRDAIRAEYEVEEADAAEAEAVEQVEQIARRVILETRAS